MGVGMPSGGLQSHLSWSYTLKCVRQKLNVKRTSCFLSTEGLSLMFRYILSLCDSKILTGPVIAGLCRRGSSH